MESRALSFERDIRPLFRPVDIEHMSGLGVSLADYAYMSNAQNAQTVYDVLKGMKMPPGGPYWSDEQLSVFARWMEQGRQP